MTSALVLAGAHFSGIDLQFRPRRYFWARENGIHLLSDIKGAQRRRMVADALEHDETEEIDPRFTLHELEGGHRQALGRLHPWFMGGEYLPSRRTKEVEIARITIASTTQDVTCIYARPVGKRIAYRIVDEYNGETLSGPAGRTSTQPLTLEELIRFFLSGWDLLACLGYNFEDGGYAREEVIGFINDASSSFYADFGPAIEAAVETWLDGMNIPLAAEE